MTLNKKEPFLQGSFYYAFSGLIGCDMSEILLLAGCRHTFSIIFIVGSSVAHKKLSSEQMIFGMNSYLSRNFRKILSVMRVFILSVFHPSHKDKLSQIDFKEKSESSI